MKSLRQPVAKPTGKEVKCLVISQWGAKACQQPCEWHWKQNLPSSVFRWDCSFGQELGCNLKRPQTRIRQLKCCPIPDLQKEWENNICSFKLLPFGEICCLIIIITIKQYTALRRQRQHIQGFLSQDYIKSYSFHLFLSEDSLLEHCLWESPDLLHKKCGCPKTVTVKMPHVGPCLSVLAEPSHMTTPAKAPDMGVKWS